MSSGRRWYTLASRANVSRLLQLHYHLLHLQILTLTFRHFYQLSGLIFQVLRKLEHETVELGDALTAWIFIKSGRVLQLGL